MTESLIKTLCKDCVFATWDSNEQIGCNLGKLEKYQWLGKAKKIDNYYEIRSLCNTCRDNNWFDSLERDEDPIFTVKQETIVPIAVMILAPENSTGWEERLINTITKLTQAKLMPKKIVIGFHQKRENTKNLVNKLQSLLIPKQIKYEIVNILEHIEDELQLIDILSNKCSFYKENNRKYNIQYTIIIHNGLEIGNSIYGLNQLINEELKQFVLIHPLKNCLTHGMVYQNILFKNLGGNKGQNFTKKVEALAQEQNLNHMVQTWDTIYQDIDIKDL